MLSLLPNEAVWLCVFVSIYIVIVVLGPERDVYNKNIDTNMTKVCPTSFDHCRGLYIVIVFSTLSLLPNKAVWLCVYVSIYIVIVA